MAFAAVEPQAGLRFLDGGGACAALIAGFDWSATACGPIASWPASLKTAVGLVVRSPLPMALLWGSDGTLLYNDGYAAIAGDRHPAALGASVLTVWPEAEDFNRTVLRDVLAGRSLSFRDQAFTLPRGGRPDQAWFSLDYSPVLTEDDQPAGVFAVVVETTQKVQAEAWLRGEQERLRQMFEQTPGFMAMLSGPEHVFEMVNPAYLQLVGHRPVVRLPIAQALPDVARQGYIELLDDVYRTGKAFIGHAVAVQLQRTPGAAEEQRFVDFVFQPVRDPAGTVRGIFIQGSDVSDRIGAEQAMRFGEVRNRQILDSAVDYAIVAFDLDGRVTRWNEGAHRILGWTEEEMLGQDGSRFFTEEDQRAGRLRAEMRAALSTGIGNDERWHVRKSGERFWANGEITPIRDEAGTVTGYVKVLRDRTEQHRAAEALRQSEERLRRAQQAGGVGTFTLDLASGRLSGTPEFFRIFGLPPCESIAASEVEPLVIPEDAHLRSRDQTRNDQSALLDVEYRIRRADDGALRWISRRAEYECDATGRAVAMVGVVLDATERKTNEAAIAQSDVQLLNFAQTLPDHAWTATPEGSIDWYNDRVIEYTGAAAGELNGAAWTNALHPDDVLPSTERWRQSLDSGEDYRTEFRLRRADGAYRWHLTRAVALRAVDDSIVRWIGTTTDIHERKLAEAQSTRDRDRIWTLSQELMLICDRSSRILAVNPAASRLLGWSEDQMVGSLLLDFIHPADRAHSANEIARLDEGAATLAFENRLRTADGDHRLMNWTAVPDGELIHAVARDVTRERSIEEALRQSQKMEAVGQLTGGVAHDFNNLLTIIRTSIDLMRRPDVSEERRQRFMASIANAVTRGGKLTGQLLAFARRQALQPTDFDAAHNVQSVSDMIATLVGSRITVEFDTDASACVVNADPSQFDTAIVNMAVNARDAMDGAGRLTIAVRSVSEIPAVRLHPAVPGAFIAVSISDTGTGIEPDQIDRIFEPFFTTKSVGLGTGLGLSQVFGFAKQSGGEIQVQSALGQGSTFTLYLPRAASAAAPVPIANDTAASVDGNGARILVVEDNPDVAGAVVETLNELGFNVQLTHSAEAALKALAQDATRFDAVFSDVVMSGMDGIQLAYEIRRRHGNLPVVLSSGYSDILAKDDSHGFDLLPKPYSLDALSRILREAIARRAAAPVPRLPASWGDLAETFIGKQEIDEQLRQTELDSMLVLDTEEEAAYDDLTRMAATFCNAPIALISLVDAERQWFKSRIGLQARETPREHAFCAHAIQQPEQVMVVNNAVHDERFVDNPLVTGDPNIRFYAGAPLVTSAGHALGTICVIDYESRDIDAKQLEMLQHLAAQVVKRLEQRRAALMPVIDS